MDWLKDYAKYFQHQQMRIHLFAFSSQSVLCVLFCMTYVIMFDQLMSTLLGCVITENIGFITSGLASCSESFVMRLQRMIIV